MKKNHQPAQSQSALDLFLKLVMIDSPSGEEQAVAKWVADYLESLGLFPEIDQHSSVFVAIPGEGSPLFFCAHLDTVEPGRGIIPQVLSDGTIRSSQSTILGADNKISVAAMLGALTAITKQHQPHRPIEMLFTASEEADSSGAKAFDTSRLKANIGFIFDKEGELGQVVTESPAYARFDIEIKGRSSHAAHRQSAVPALPILPHLIQKLDAINRQSTFVNIGKISGGTARNTVIGTLALSGEIRSFSPDHFLTTLDQIKQIISDSRQKFPEGEITSSLIIENQGYVHQPSSVRKIIQLLSEHTDIALTPVTSFGCSDANIFNNQKRALRVFNLSDGSFHHHTTQEYATTENLDQLTQLIQNLMTSTQPL